MLSEGARGSRDNVSGLPIGLNKDIMGRGSTNHHPPRNPHRLLIHLLHLPLRPPQLVRPDQPPQLHPPMPLPLRPSRFPQRKLRFLPFPVRLLLRREAGLGGYGGDGDGEGERVRGRGGVGQEGEGGEGGEDGFEVLWGCAVSCQWLSVTGCFDDITPPPGQNSFLAWRRGG